LSEEFLRVDKWSLCRGYRRGNAAPIVTCTEFDLVRKPPNRKSEPTAAGTAVLFPRGNSFYCFYDQATALKLRKLIK
jgi:hypothetical protein